MKRFFKKVTASLLTALLLLSYTPNASASSLSDVSTEMSYSLLQDIIDLYLETSLYESDRETLINTMLYNYLASDPLALASLANALLSANDPYSAYYLADSGFLSDSSKAYGVIVEDSDGFDEDDSRAPGVYIRDVIKVLNPVLRGWSNYFRTGNAAKRFNQLDTYVWQRLKALRIARKGRHLKPGDAARWSRESFHKLGLIRLRGRVKYPESSKLWEAA